MIFSPVNNNRHLTCIFENLVLGADSLNFVNMFKYLGYVLTNDLHDDDDMLKQMSLFMAGQIRSQEIFQMWCPSETVPV